MQPDEESDTSSNETDTESNDKRTSGPTTPAIKSRDLKNAIAGYLRLHGNIYENEEAVINKILHDTPRTRQGKRKMEESPSFQEETIKTPMDRRRRIQPKSPENKEKSPTPKLSPKQQQSMATLRKDKQLRKQQFNHRFQTYKRRGFVRKKFDIGKENKKKRDAQLKTKRDLRWLFTTKDLSESNGTHILAIISVCVQFTEKYEASFESLDNWLQNGV